MISLLTGCGELTITSVTTGSFSTLLTDTTLGSPLFVAIILPGDLEELMTLPYVGTVVVVVVVVGWATTLRLWVIPGKTLEA